MFPAQEPYLLGIWNAWAKFIWFFEAEQIFTTAAEIHSTNFAAGKFMKIMVWCHRPAININITIDNNSAHFIAHVASAAEQFLRVNGIHWRLFVDQVVGA